MKYIRNSINLNLINIFLMAFLISSKYGAEIIPNASGDRISVISLNQQCGEIFPEKSFSFSIKIHGKFELETRVDNIILYEVSNPNNTIPVTCHLLVIIQNDTELIKEEEKNSLVCKVKTFPIKEGKYTAKLEENQKYKSPDYGTITLTAFNLKGSTYIYQTFRKHYILNDTLPIYFYDYIHGDKGLIKLKFNEEIENKNDLPTIIFNENNTLKCEISTESSEYLICEVNLNVFPYDYEFDNVKKYYGELINICDQKENDLFLFVYNLTKISFNETQFPEKCSNLKFNTHFKLIYEKEGKYNQPSSSINIKLKNINSSESNEITTFCYTDGGNSFYYDCATIQRPFIEGEYKAYIDENENYPYFYEKYLSEESIYYTKYSYVFPINHTINFAHNYYDNLNGTFYILFSGEIKDKFPIIYMNNQSINCKAEIYNLYHCSFTYEQLPTQENETTIYTGKIINICGYEEDNKIYLTVLNKKVDLTYITIKNVSFIQNCYTFLRPTYEFSLEFERIGDNNLPFYITDIKLINVNDSSKIINTYCENKENKNFLLCYTLSNPNEQLGEYYVILQNAYYIENYYIYQFNDTETTAFFTNKSYNKPIDTNVIVNHDYFYNEQGSFVLNFEKEIDVDYIPKLLVNNNDNKELNCEINAKKFYQLLCYFNESLLPISSEKRVTKTYKVNLLNICNKYDDINITINVKKSLFTHINITNIIYNYESCSNILPSELEIILDIIREGEEDKDLLSLNNKEIKLRNLDDLSFINLNCENKNPELINKLVCNISEAITVFGEYQIYIPYEIQINDKFILNSYLSEKTISFSKFENIKPIYEKIFIEKDYFNGDNGTFSVLFQKEISKEKGTMPSFIFENNDSIGKFYCDVNEKIKNEIICNFDAFQLGYIPNKNYSYFPKLINVCNKKDNDLNIEINVWKTPDPIVIYFDKLDKYNKCGIINKYDFINGAINIKDDKKYSGKIRNLSEFKLINVEEPKNYLNLTCEIIKNDLNCTILNDPIIKGEYKLGIDNDIIVENDFTFTKFYSKESIYFNNLTYNPPINRNYSIYHDYNKSNRGHLKIEFLYDLNEHYLPLVKSKFTTLKCKKDSEEDNILSCEFTTRDFKGDNNQLKKYIHHVAYLINICGQIEFSLEVNVCFINYIRTNFILLSIIMILIYAL